MYVHLLLESLSVTIQRWAHKTAQGHGLAHYLFPRFKNLVFSILNHHSHGVLFRKNSDYRSDLSLVNTLTWQCGLLEHKSLIERRGSVCTFKMCSRELLSCIIKLCPQENYLRHRGWSSKVVGRGTPALATTPFTWLSAARSPGGINIFSSNTTQPWKTFTAGSPYRPNYANLKSSHTHLMEDALKSLLECV